MCATALLIAAGATARANDTAGEAAAAALCPDVSALPCEQVKANLPLDLDFGVGASGYGDREGEGTGFTMVQKSTTGAYRPELLNVEAGTLTVRTTNGIQYKTPSTTTNGNTLDNGLGVGLDASRKLRLETTIVNPTRGTGGSQQAGLWFGPDEDHYVKIVVASARNTATPHRIQLVREVGGASAPADELNFDGSPANSLDLSTATVHLILVIDPAGRATASYKIGDNPEQALGELAIPASFVDGTRVPADARAAGSTGFGGLFATHRNGPSPVDLTFGEFTVAEVAPPAGAGNLEVTPDRIVTNQPTGAGAGPAQVVTIRNTGTGPLQLQSPTVSGTGFAVTKQPAASVPAGGETTAEVAFDPSAAGPSLATLTVRSDDPDTPNALVKLNGLGTAGLGGANEPSLQSILDTYEIPIRVGDDDAGTNVIHSAPAQQRAALLGDEVPAPLFEKAGAGSVTVEPLAVFGPTDANPVVGFGRHTPGDAGARTELFSISNTPVSNGQTLQVPGGTRSFDPGAAPFALYSQWPFFTNRVVSSEDARNTWSDGNRHHVRAYALPGASNAYVVATEEHTSGWDFQDVVAIVRNVRPAAAAASGDIEVENLDGVPFADRLVFNRIQTQASGGNGVHDTGVVRVRNTGNAALTLAGLTVSAGWELVTPPATPRTLAPGESVDLTVRFVATSGAIHNGTLTIASSDPDEPSTAVQLAGFWQSVSEGGQEPDLGEIVRLYGYGTRVPLGAASNNGGRLVKVGDETNSRFWKRADTTKPVQVRQLAAFHTQGNTATFFTTRKTVGTTAPASTTRLVHLGFDGQSLLPRKDDAQRTPGVASFTPTTADTGTSGGTDPDDGTFGFRIDPEYSDWRVNNTGGGVDAECLAAKQTDPTVECGYHLRAFAVRDRAGRLVPDQWLVVMDYAGINYDFQDNVYLVFNVKPENPADDPNVQQPCTPVACENVAVGIPYALDFSGPRAGSVLDKDDEGTGFTSVEKPANGTGYIKGNLDVAGGALALTTTKGLMFSPTTNNPDSQDNQLGVGLKWRERAAMTPVAITTRLLSPPAGERKIEQGGLWFGRDGDNYVKLVVGSMNTGAGPATQIQFLREQERVSGPADQCTTPAIDLAGKDVDLKLVADPASHRVTAAYTVSGAGEVTLPCSFVVPGSWFDEDPVVRDERIGTASFAGVFGSHRNGTAPLVYRFDSFAVGAEQVELRPRVLRSRPADGATGVERDVAIATDLSLPNGSVDNTTVTAQAVRLVRVSDGSAVPGTQGTSGGGDTLTFTPAAQLAASTQYRFEVTDAVRDLSGARFEPYSATFTTGTGTTDPGSGDSTAAFDKVVLPTATAPQYKGFTSMAVGPDGKLYAGRNDGEIRRFTIGADGQLGTAEAISSLRNANGGDRLLAGIEFDPASTAANPVLWVTHTTYGFGGMADWGGKITRLSGADLQNVQDYVINLPRSARDHVTNGIDIKDGKLYITQGSNSAMGAPDSSWSNRDERLLSGAVLQLDPTKVTNPPLDAKTADGGTYDPYAPSAPLTVFASGVRNAFDLAWHSNGQLYVPTNGSAAGGNTPTTPSQLPGSCARRGYTGPAVTGSTNVGQTQHDWLFRAVEGGYYGHPNPARCEWVLNGGNPTAGTDPAEVSTYPVGTQPDPNYRGAAFDFGLNKSPNGVTEYRSTATFGGTLAGKLLVVRYSNNDDIIALTPGANGDIVRSQTDIPGASGFKDPLDVVEDPSGNLYVSEYDQLGSGPKITLLKARDTGQPPVEPVATLPFALDWDGPEGGLGGTGFTSVQASTTGAHKPELLRVDGGRLTITTTAGIQYRAVNSLDNGMAVRLPDARKLELTTTLVNPPLGTNSAEQGGLWFGTGQDDYVKLVVASTATGTTVHHRAQLLRERGGVSNATADPATSDELNTTGTPNWSAERVRLRLVVDPAANTAEAFYRVGDGAELRLGQLTVPAGFFTGPRGGVFATHRNNTATTGLEFAFDDFSVTEERGPNRAPTVASVADRTDRAGDPIDLAMTGSDLDGDTLTWSAEGLPPGLAINGASGRITGTLAESAVRQQPFSVTVRASDPGGESGTATFAWTVNPQLPPPSVDDLKVNFQNEAAAIPPGYVKDYGQPYGSRGEFMYGWVVPGSSTPLDLTRNGRERVGTGLDPRLATFMHMQYDDVANPTNGTPAEGAWELAVPDGAYDVTLSVGEPNAGVDPEVHTVRAEGTAVVAGFVPSGPANMLTRFKSGTARAVQVTDGRLTLDAVGGRNTKINYVDIARVEAPNGAPSIAVGDQTNAEGDEVSVPLAGEDPDGDDLTYTATGLPPGLKVEGDRIVGTIEPGVRVYDVTVTVSDGKADAEDTITWTVTTAPRPNREPVIAAIADQSNKVGDAVALQVHASDPDGDALVYTAENLPGGLRIDQTTGRIAGTLTAVGTSEVRIRVQDSGSSATAGLRWSVTAQPTPPVDPPVDPRKPIRVNAGGPALTFGGTAWLGCRSGASCQVEVTGGKPRALAGGRAIRGVASPAGAALYRSEWTAGKGTPGRTAFRFELPVKDGAYTVRLHFAELDAKRQGRRTFDVNVEGGRTELARLDVVAEAGGRNRALVRELPVRVRDGDASIAFVRRTGSPMVSGIEVVPAASAAPVRTTALTVAAAGRRVGGRLTGAAPGALVTLEAQRPGSRRPAALGTARTGADGSYRLTTARLPRGTRIWARFAGYGAALPAAVTTRIR